MAKRKEYKRVRKQVHIDNVRNFTDNLQRFLDKNPDAKIEHILQHKAYHITIIYSELKEIVHCENKHR